MTKFENSDYARITKLDKSGYDKIKKSIFNVSQKLGQGVSNPVAYDTAWVARVPQLNELSCPAFPQCLQWLRNNQNQDGSWGDDHPRSTCSKVLNTFSSVLALAQWGRPEDETKKKRGIDALWTLTEKLPLLVPQGFEMIISSFVDEGREFQLDLPFELFEQFSKSGEEGLEKLKSELITNEPSKFWTFLEASGKTVDLDIEYYRSEIIRYGFIGSQPSTTAFLLRYARLRGKNFPEAEWILEKLVAENNGSVPHFFSSDNFELICGLHFLFAVGIDARKSSKHGATKKAVETFIKRWDFRNGIGFSSKWPIPDAFCTAASVIIFNKYLNMEHGYSFGKKFNVPKCKPRMRPSFGVDPGVYDCKVGKSKSDILPNASFDDDVIDNNDDLCFENEPFFDSIQNVSKLYNVMRLVLCPPRKINCCKIVNLLLRTQNSDGGWGDSGVSTVEETSYVCLIIFHFVRKNCELLKSINFSKLVEFINSADALSNSGCFWFWKVTFHSPALSELVLSAARYAVFQIQRLSIMTDVLNETKLDLSEIEILGEHDQLIYRGNILRLQAEVRLEDIEIDQRDMMNIIKEDILCGEHPSAYMKSLIDVSLQYSYFTHPIKLSAIDRTIETMMIVYTFMIDDIVDTYLPGKSGFVDPLCKLFDTTIAILEGKIWDPGVETTLDFPDYPHFIKSLWHKRNFMEKRGWDVEVYIKELDRLFREVYAPSYRDVSQNVKPTAKRYLQLQTVGSGLEMVVEHSCLLEGTGSSKKFKNWAPYRRFITSACKACRIFADIPSVMKDSKQSTFDNYCLRLQHEYNVSINEAVEIAVKKANKEVIKMCTLKKMMLNNPTFKDNKDLAVCLRLAECYVDGTLEWSLTTSRYKSEWTLKNTRVPHRKQKKHFVQDLCFY